MGLPDGALCDLGRPADALEVRALLRAHGLAGWTARHSRGRRSWCWPKTRTITLAEGGRWRVVGAYEEYPTVRRYLRGQGLDFARTPAHPAVLLHEIAHALVHARTGRLGHGPEFCRELCALLRAHMPECFRD